MDAFNALFAQTTTTPASNATTAEEQELAQQYACRYERSMRRAEKTLLRLSGRYSYGNGSGGGGGGSGGSGGSGSTRPSGRGEGTEAQQQEREEGPTEAQETQEAEAGPAVLQPFDTYIPRDVVARPPEELGRGYGITTEPAAADYPGGSIGFVRMGSRIIAACVAPDLSASGVCFDGLDSEQADEQLRPDNSLEYVEGAAAVVAVAAAVPVGAAAGIDSHAGDGAAHPVDPSESERIGSGVAIPQQQLQNSIIETEQHGDEDRDRFRPESAAGQSTASNSTVHTRPDDEYLHVHAIKVTAPTHSHRPSHVTGSLPPPLVLVHGYANGALYFYRNLHGLSRHFPVVYSIDMLGWGLSSRPTYATRDDTVAAAEEFFVEGLEAWRKANGIDQMILGGHSLGGYVSVAYSERYPQHVAQLLLLSPVGVQEAPDFDRQSKSAVQRVIYGTMRNLLTSGWTPGAVVRAVSGRKSVESYVDKRLPGVSCREERAALIDYLFNNAMLPPSGERCLGRLLLPGAFALDPLCHRIPNLRVADVTFIYGEKDWMDPSAGLDVQHHCRHRRAEGDLKVPEVTVHAVRDAGHLLMIENWRSFNAAVVQSCGLPLGAELIQHKPAAFFDRKKRSYPRPMVNGISVAQSESTHESGDSRESVELDLTGRYIIEEEEDFVEYGNNERTWTESCTGVSLRKPTS